MSNDPSTTPVIIGVGQINDRPHVPTDGLDPIDLMAHALRRADSDAGGDWLDRCDSLTVIRQIAFPDLAAADEHLVTRMGIEPALHETTPVANGDNPTRQLNEAANRIGRGEATVCAVVGAEALRTAGARVAARKIADAAGSAAGVKDSADPKPDILRDASHRRMKGYAPSYGLVAPTDVYPLLENALRASLGQSLAEAQEESAMLWFGMSKVAAQNESAWIPKEFAPDDIIKAGPSNRPIAFPYTKLQVANSSVNQGAGFLVTSLEEARRQGVPDERLVFVGHGASANEAYDCLIRERYDSSPSMEVSIGKAMELNGVSAEDLAHIELYSCFPCIPKMARRIAGWPLDRPITVFGGLTFGGGPVGNYMSHAIAEMVVRLRGTQDKGLLFGNGGAYATHNHTILLSGAPTGAQFPQDFDFQADADALRGPIPDIDEDYEGPAEIETFTVFYERDGSARAGVVVAKTPDGARTLAAVPASDEATIAFLTDGASEPVGSAGIVARGGDELALWKRA